MLAVRIPDEMETRLDKLAALTGRPKSYYVREALQAHLDDIEDTHTALYRLEHPARRWTLGELEKGLDLKSDLERAWTVEFDDRARRELHRPPAKRIGHRSDCIGVQAGCGGNQVSIDKQ